MNTILLTAGVVALMAAVIGGGLKAFNIEMPVLQGGGVRAALAALGVVFLVAAFLLRDDAGGGGGDGDRQAASYRRQVVAACNAVRRSSGRNRFGTPRPKVDLEADTPSATIVYDRDRVISGLRGAFAANRRRFELLFDKPAPESLEGEAKSARSRFETFDRESRGFVAGFAADLPPEPTPEDIEAASAPHEDRFDEVTAELEDAMTRLAGQDCNITANA